METEEADRDSAETLVVEETVAEPSAEETEAGETGAAMELASGAAQMRADAAVEAA